MYVSKNRGSGCEFYEPKHDHHSVRRLGMIGQLRDAVEKNEIELHYQPKIDLKADRVHGAEALLRWDHPALGKINPEEFIAAVDTSDLIEVLTDWTLENAFRQIRDWRANQIDGPIAINLSARLLRDRRFSRRLEQLLAAAAVEPSDLELEITESALMVDRARAIETIDRIRNLGTQVSIDDYGTGYSSLAYLRDLNPNALKIDKCYVMNMHENDSDRVIVESTIQMAHGLGLNVVAEGVESEWAHDHLRRSGCDYAQGYWYSEALHASDFIKWARSYNKNAPLPESANDDAILQVGSRRKSI